MGRPSLRLLERDRRPRRENSFHALSRGFLETAYLQVDMQVRKLFASGFERHRLDALRPAEIESGGVRPKQKSAEKEVAREREAKERKPLQIAKNQTLAIALIHIPE